MKPMVLRNAAPRERDTQIRRIGRRRLNRPRPAYTFQRDSRNRWGRAGRPHLSRHRSMTIRTALFWGAVLCCLVAQLAILRSVLFGRAAASATGTPHAAPARRPIEVAWAVLPALALLLVLYLTWLAVDAPRPVGPDVSVSGVTIGV